MRIILSGGWGFGNLGDDAILLASIKLLKHKYPLSNIVVITNNVKETEQILIGQSEVSVEESIFKKIFGDTRINLPINISQKIRKHIKRKIKKYTVRINSVINSDSLFLGTYFTDNADALESFRRLCESASMYIMSGGGYLNEWKEMAIAKYIESTIANKYGLKCYLIGQTIGPFISKGSFNIVSNICTLMQAIFYRDVDSIFDTKRMELECLDEAIPDLALYENFSFEKKNQIVFVPFKKDVVENIDNLCNNIEKIAENDNSKIIVAVTQLWSVQIEIALFVYYSLLYRNVNVEICIPKNVLELQSLLGESRLVISQNLHGLIMAYRSNTPVISLNAGRKFVSFMKMIHASDLIIEPKLITEFSLYDLYKKAFDESRENEMEIFIRQIENAIDKTLN